MTLKVPDGNPASLAARAATLVNLADNVSNRMQTLATRRDATLTALPTRRVPDFRAASMDAATALEGGGLGITAVARQVRTYAESLDGTQTVVREVNRRVGSLEDQVSAARAVEDWDEVDRLRGETRRERGIGEDALDDFERARRQAINDLLAEADLWAPGSSSMVPVEAWVLASAAIVPADVGIDRRDLRKVWRAVDGDNSRMITQQATKAKAAGTRGWQLYQLGSYGRVARLNRNVEAQYAAARSVYTVAQGSPGDLRGMVRAEKGLVRALNRLVAQPATRTSQAQRLYGLYESLVGKDKAWDLVHTRYPDVPGDSIRPLRSPVMTRINRITRAVGPVASRVMGPVSALMGGYDVITGVTDDSLPADVRTSRVIGGAGSLAAGAATTAIAFGLVAATPVGVAVIAVGSVAALGSWAYEPSEAIADTARNVGGAVVDGTKKVWGWLSGGD
ncbi:hypothetical protein BJF80_13465 [Serinicoccus sp. CUA-874]|uniref:hypothetical protein n=1 Tax=Serinicoccus sp. CUA-874 TaxID=1517939 RepID=UPI000961F1AA|nr:hypothetical protein [Serinicoccus sp. CUA-874]OLT19046.1 hypothetical protein BJF80_13465 [Serinicoccus sp. CUA-874]